MSDKKPTLCAFEVYDMAGRYNVWRYDTPSTELVIYCHKAESEADAIKAAQAKISEGEA